jgi:hypothetical protein
MVVVILNGHLVEIFVGSCSTILYEENRSSENDQMNSMFSKRKYELYFYNTQNRKIRPHPLGMF